MIEKFSTYFAHGDDSFDTKMKLTIKFLEQNGVKVNQKQVVNTLSLAAVHQHGEVFSNLLIGLITKLFVKTSTVNTINVRDGTFSISMMAKQFS